MASVSAEVIDGLVHHWRTAYNWRAHEAQLNEHLFSVSIDGLRVVFKHFTQPAGAAARVRARAPVLLLHGWPGSIVEFKRFARLLLHDGHDVVLPCLPGYGWSDAPNAPGFDVTATAITMLKLMHTLGYHGRYAAQAGDWGAIVAQRMAQIDPSSMVGVHLNFAPIALPDSLLTVASLLLSGEPAQIQRFKDNFDLFKVLDATG